MFWVEIDGIFFGDFDDFFDSFVNEDNGDQVSEVFFGKFCDVLYKCIEVKGYYKYDDNCCLDFCLCLERYVILFLIIIENYLKNKG